MSQVFTCPRCKQECIGEPALSRKDNKTEICSDCGEKEALEGFADFLWICQEYS